MFKFLTSWVVVTLVSLTLVEANYYPVEPTASTVWTAGKKEIVVWKDDGKAPPLSKLGKTSIQLWTGGAQSQTFLDDLGTVDASSGKMSIEVNPSLGESGHWYFLRFRGANRSATLDSFSARFTLNGMKGTFSQTIKQQLASLNSSNTSTSTSNSTSLTNTTSPTNTTNSSSSTSLPSYGQPTTSSPSGIGASPVTPVSSRPSPSGQSASNATRLQTFTTLYIVSFILASMMTLLWTSTTLL